CYLHGLYLHGKEQQPAVDLAEMFQRRKCNHREAIPADECLGNVVDLRRMHMHRYILATQTRAIAAVPILHMNRSVIIL
ncbi:hypothetical protein L227DRAFT_487450, partial [Lentinus tigrinus ALCF2SS1-6]